MTGRRRRCFQCFRPAFRRIELAVGIARAEAQSRRPLARIDDAIGAARAVARGRDRLEHVVEAAADLRTAGAEGAARIGAAELVAQRSEEHTSELQSLMRNSYAVFCLKKKTQQDINIT